MLDPFFAPPQQLIKAIRPIANHLGLFTLPLHFHEAIFAWACYHVVNTFVSPKLSLWLFPSRYANLSTRATINWNVHVTSLVQSSFISIFALVVMFCDQDRKEMDWVERLWGYSGAGGAVQGLAAGYFLWDLVVSGMNVGVLGWGSLAHAASALLVTSLGFRPFANYYGLNFILYEISTPFLNIHWFCDKFNMTGSRLQLYNGIILTLSFFLCRIVWGNYQSFRIYSDLWTAYAGQHDSKLAGDFSHLYQNHALGTAVDDGSGKIALPAWLVVVYVGSNTVLNLLNLYWFSRMVRTLGKRFQPVKPVSRTEKIKS